jgi:hypothetical protein
MLLAAITGSLFMDDRLDGTEKTPPVTMPVPKLDIEPLATERAADGTRSKLTLPPPIPARARRASTVPPPIPARARASAQPPPTPARARVGTQPPPIPTAAFPLAKPVEAVPPIAATPAPATLDWSIDAPANGHAQGTPAPELVAPRVESVDTPLPVRANAPMAVPLAMPPDLQSDDVPIDIDVPSVVVAPSAVAPVAPLELDDKAAGEAAAGALDLPPLPRPSAEWTRTQSSVIAVRPPTGSAEIAFFDAGDAANEDGDVAPTTYFERSDGARPLNKKLVAGIGGGVLVAGLVFALAFRGGDAKPSAPVAHAPQQEVTPHKRTHSTKPTKTVAAVETAAPAPTTVAPVAAPIETATPSTAAVTNTATMQVPISSWPQGAIVTLVDNGSATVIGKTPMIASLDPSRSYDVVLAVKDRPTTVTHFDPKSMHEVTIDLDPAPAAATHKRVAAVEPVQSAAPAPVTQHTTTAHAPAVTAPAPAPAHTQRAATAPTPKAAPMTTAPVATKPAKPQPAPKQQVARNAALTAAPAPTAEVTGTLMISSKPPCEIVVDGKPTHLTTPQAALPLSPGAHAITLINSAQSIKKSIAVHIEAKRATKLVQDFTH